MYGARNVSLGLKICGVKLNTSSYTVVYILLQLNCWRTCPTSRMASKRHFCSSIIPSQKHLCTSSVDIPVYFTHQGAMETNLPYPCSRNAYRLLTGFIISKYLQGCFR
ncbi:unnamed protein product [Cuscuta epithymum]|uniref:Uncharacterized protein n=1 Tax=Cuscuta epithymum TaxID=186058 RepID=A0AAV0C432_9ASTE|nr:unnamed protein product [Cuscuta epithymum]